MRLLPLLTAAETRVAEEAHRGSLDELMERAGGAYTGLGATTDATLVRKAHEETFVLKQGTPTATAAAGCARCANVLSPEAVRSASRPSTHGAR